MSSLEESWRKESSLPLRCVGVVLVAMYLRRHSSRLYGIGLVVTVREREIKKWERNNMSRIILYSFKLTLFALFYINPIYFFLTIFSKI